MPPTNYEPPPKLEVSELVHQLAMVLAPATRIQPMTTAVMCDLTFSFALSPPHISTQPIMTITRITTAHAIGVMTLTISLTELVTEFVTPLRSAALAVVAAESAYSLPYMQPSGLL